MNCSKRRARLREILSGGECVYPASVFDPVSARLAEKLGFESLMVAGSVASWAILGAPDKILITLSELASLTKRIARATEVPLLIDADHGYGNALNVARTVEELETAGAAGLTIEDTLLPAPYGKTGKAGLIPLEEGVGKMRAALWARQYSGFVIVGRTSGLTIVGIEETIARIQAYEAAGVDAIFIAGIKKESELTALAAAVKLPFILGPTAPDLLMNRALLAAHRVRICLQGHQTFWAAVQGAQNALAALRAGTAPEKLPVSRQITWLRTLPVERCTRVRKPIF